MSEATVSREAVKLYIDTLFAHVDWAEGGIISLLGVGEKHTKAEGVLRERKFIDPRSAFAIEAIMGHLQRWAVHSGGGFIVPAVVQPHAEAEGDVRLDKVAALTAIVADIDSGDTDAKLIHAEQHLGAASFLVESGGTTESGHAKRHCYWMLSEPESDVEAVAELRKKLASKIGGDQSFGRATQVIRIPGSIYGKAGAKRAVTMHAGSSVDYHLSDLAEAIDAMPVMPGCEPVDNVVALPLSFGANGVMDFSGGAGRDMNALQTALTSPISEGGDADRSRWSEASRVLGHYVAMVRRGEYSVEAAFEHAQGWNLAQMKPPFPEQRMRTEWVALYNLDVQRHGPMPGQVVGCLAPADTWKAPLNDVNDLLSWAVASRTNFEPPEQRDLVSGVIRAGNKNMLVAEGAAGKSFLMMDLALKIATSRDDTSPQTWLGQPLTGECEGGTVILISAEDDAEELHRRWHRLDPDFQRRSAAGARLIALPLEVFGGSFPFVDPAHTDRASEQWSRIFERMLELSRLPGTKIVAVIVDTLNATYHGEENAATTAGEYLRAITPICGALGAAAIVTHHIKKPGKEGIKSAEDMYEAVRGSSALPNGMRSVVGVWHSHDHKRLLKALGQKQASKRLYHAAVLKANGLHMTDTRTLLRNEFGLLEDVTMAIASSRGNHAERKAWFLFTIGWYANEGTFFTISSRTTGLHKHRHRFIDSFHNISVREIEGLAQELLDEGKLIQRRVGGLGNTLQWLDLKSHAKKQRTRGEQGREPPEPAWDEFVYEPTNNKIVALARPM